MIRRQILRTVARAAIMVAVPLVAACDDESLTPPTPVDAMFARYVSFGNSLTAGFQSGGINDSTQLESYAVLLAEQMGLEVGSDFNVPLLNPPGCPAPITNIFTQERLGNTSATDCALRQAPIPTSIHNVAFPGADVLELLDLFSPDIVPSATDVYKTFLLGGRTEIEAAREIAPTFVTVWIGNNDVLGAILDQSDAGNSSLITPPQTFAARYASVMDSLDSFGSIQGGVLIGVVQVTGAPWVSRGGAYFLAGTAIPTLTVDVNCLAFQVIPGTSDTAFVMVPFQYGAPLVGQAAAGVPTTLDCSVPQVISEQEALNMIATVAQYNAAIAQEAADRDWVFVDPNPLLVQLAADPSAIRPFPAFPPDPAFLTAPFGTAVSRDGIHANAVSHRLVADALIAAINAKYSTSIASVP